MHSPHPDVHEHGLQDNCGECALHAERPFASLDHYMLSALVVMAIERREGRYTLYPRSENEAIATANVMNALEHVDKIMEAAQLTGNLDKVKGYYNKYWRIPLS